MIFISYSRTDKSLVLPLVKLLRASGQEVFVDEQNLQYGEDWKAQIASAIHKSSRFLLFWSKSSADSEYVREELSHAKEISNVKIVPIILDSTPLPAELELFHGSDDLTPIFASLIEARKHRRLLQWAWGTPTLASGAFLIWMVYRFLSGQAGMGAAAPNYAIYALYAILIVLVAWIVPVSIPFGVSMVISWRRRRAHYHLLAKKLMT